jgi:hypothetical protein
MNPVSPSNLAALHEHAGLHLGVSSVLVPVSLTMYVFSHLLAPSLLVTSTPARLHLYTLLNTSSRLSFHASALTGRDTHFSADAGFCSPISTAPFLI